MKRSRIQKHGLPQLAAAIAAWAVVGLSALGAEAAPPTATTTLYDRIGGYDFIARFVDTAFPRVASHPQLQRLFKGHSQDSQIRQRQLIVDAICLEMGGPCMYIGRAMKPVHTGLGITGSDWAVFMTIITRTLDELKVPAEEKRGFVEVFEKRFRPVVVEAS